MAVTTVSMHYSTVKIQQASNNFLSEKNLILMTDNEATRTTFVGTRPAWREE